MSFSEPSAEGTLAERVALVTGAARGMGLATARALASRGATVYLNDLSEERARAAAAEIGPRGHGLPGNVGDGARVRAMIDEIVLETGRLDVLVNSAGVLFPTRFLEIPEDEWRATIDVNLTGAFLCSQAAAAHMKRRGWGRIVNLSSTAGKTVSTLGGAHYTASKSGVLGLTRAAALELAPHGITVNAVCPGLIDTEMARENATPDRLTEYARSFPVGRLGTPDEVAELICFLVSEAAAYITGAAIDVNGGDLMV